MPYADPQKAKEHRHEYYLANKDRLQQSARKWREEHPELIREYRKAWRLRHPEQFRLSENKRRRGKPLTAAQKEYMRQYYPKNLDKWRAASVRARQKYPEKVKARELLNVAVKAGKLERSPVCALCGTECKTQAHHHNGYAKEAALDAVWVCAKCHRSLHVF